ncbi:hypothetical protein B0T11DRAFT_117942 [Plectosphaerella cucumerina]|uniref:Uncharacterized protein n=1 Tax=Plectosphaerella cucumerina TaxID=40658 RepID=A0A8K0T9L2_9PEZI|nr:hypothetical protein B0T11DRAFT_117942 [Plectosphaerella cucumerina]
MKTCDDCSTERWRYASLSDGAVASGLPIEARSEPEGGGLKESGPGRSYHGRGSALVGGQKREKMTRRGCNTSNHRERFKAKSMAGRAVGLEEQHAAWQVGLPPPGRVRRICQPSRAVWVVPRASYRGSPTGIPARPQVASSSHQPRRGWGGRYLRGFAAIRRGAMWWNPGCGHGGRQISSQGPDASTRTHGSQAGFQDLRPSGAGFRVGLVISRRAKHVGWHGRGREQRDAMWEGRIQISGRGK